VGRDESKRLSGACVVTVGSYWQTNRKGEVPKKGRSQVKVGLKVSSGRIENTLEGVHDTLVLLAVRCLA